MMASLVAYLVALHSGVLPNSVCTAMTVGW